MYASSIDNDDMDSIVGWLMPRNILTNKPMFMRLLLPVAATTATAAAVKPRLLHHHHSHYRHRFSSLCVVDGRNRIKQKRSECVCV